MPTVTWLHLTDLHRGAASESSPWANVREELYRDIRDMARTNGPIHLVAFTGDLTNTGAWPEFEAFGATVDELKEVLADSGSTPTWLFVPGNHDLQRPPLAHEPVVRVLDEFWHLDRQLREMFWSQPDNPYRLVSRDAFANYERWFGGYSANMATMKRGLMPGDFSATLEVEGLKIGVLGLNTAFLQLSKRDYHGRLELTAGQAEGACQEDLPTWSSRHDACLLLTHHPPAWLCDEAQDTLRSEVYPPGRFLAHLFGHMHVPRATNISEGGAASRRLWQGASAFGLKTLKDGNSRVYGYSLAQLNFEKSSAHVRLWPRVAAKGQSGHWRVDRDVTFTLEPDGGTRPEPFERAKTRPASPRARAVGTDSAEIPARPQGAEARLGPSLDEMVLANLSKWALVEAGGRLPLEGTAQAPITVPEIRAPLLGEFDTKKVVDALMSMGERQFLADCKDYEALIDNGNFDPCAEYPPIKYFVRSRSFPQLNVLFEYTDQPELKQNLALVGPKGSGKTLHQNCWLSENHAQIEARKIIWVRCDCHRLFLAWHQTGDFDSRLDRLVGLEEYLSLKLLYVLARRGREPARALLYEAIQCLSRSGKYDEPVGRASDATEERDIGEAFQRVCATVDREEQLIRPGQPWFRYLEDSVISDAQKSIHAREYRRWLALARAIENALQRAGFRFLRILDGIDNVHSTSRRWSRAYVKMIKEAASFIGHRPGDARFNMAVLRERSYLDVKAAQAFPSGRPEQLDYRKIDLLPTEPYEVQRARFEFWAARTPRRTTELSRILDSIGRLTLDQAPDAYHYNHRAFQHNRLTLARHVYYRLLQLGRVGEVEKDSIDAQVRNLSERNLLLNGRFFYDTTNDWAEMDQEIGECSFNIFHVRFDESRQDREGASSSSSVSQVLQCCRVLQMIVCNRGVTQDDSETYLSTMFGYRADVTERCLILLRAFGMIDSTQPAEGPIAFEASPAGERFLRRSFTDVDTLYYCALDTPLPPSLVTGGRIHCHNNKIKGRSGYPFASIATAFTFLAFLSHVGAKEASQLAWRVGQLPAKLRALQFEVALPHEDRFGQELLRRSFRAALGSARADERERARLADFFGSALSV